MGFIWGLSGFSLWEAVHMFFWLWWHFDGALSKKQEHKIKIILTNMVLHSVACCTDAGVRSSTTGVEGECFLHRGQNKRIVCYVSVSLVLLPVMHNECPRHALSIEFEYKLTRVSLTWLPRLGPNSICVKASMPLFCLQLGSKPWRQPIERLRYSVVQHLVRGTIHENTKACYVKEYYIKQHLHVLK